MSAPISPVNIKNSPPVAVFAYCMSSIMMTVTNKYVLSGGTFNFNFILLAVQSVVCLAVISGLKASGVISFRDFSSHEAKMWYPISALLVAMIYTASKATQYLSIPVFTIFKNVTIILIAYGEVLWFGGKVTPMIMGSFGLIVLSSVVAAWSDITSPGADSNSTIFNAGYFWMFTNCMSNAAFVLFMRKRIKLTNFSDLDTMFYNNLLAIPTMLILSLFLEDWSAQNVALNFPPATRNTVILLMVMSGFFSLGISYTSGWCIRVTSSTTYSMVGALNKLPVAISGLIFFDTPATFSSVSAIFLGFLAGLFYSVAKIKQKKEADMALPTNSKA